MTKDVGRPKLEYNQEIGDAICELLVMGFSLRRVIKEGEKETGFKMPAISTFFKWLRDNPDFAKQYARAKQEAADAMAEELLDIADDGKNDWMEIWDKEGENLIGWKVNGEAVQRSKLRVETRKFLMAKMKPKKYGEKLDLTSGGERIVQQPMYISEIKSRNVKTEAETEASS